MNDLFLLFLHSQRFFGSVSNRTRLLITYRTRQRLTKGLFIICLRELPDKNSPEQELKWSTIKKHTAEETTQIQKGQ